jgi:hypothetical protein
MKYLSLFDARSSVYHTGLRVSALVFVLAFGATAYGCSGGGRGDVPASSTSSSTRSNARKRAIPILTSSVIPPGQRLRGDGDADNPRDYDGNGDGDGNEDHDEDNPVPQSYKFPDSDDKATFAYGHVPTVGERTAIEKVVKRYYAAAAVGDGATACSLLLTTLAHSLAEAYDQQSGPSYLRGATTCRTIASKLFAHLREQLAEAITIVEVRVEGSSARVVLSSRKMRASDISLLRQDRAWKLEELLGQPLP